MIKRSALRRRLAWAALVVLFGSVMAILRLQQRIAAPVTPTAGCRAGAPDSMRLARLATDTIATLRVRTQRVQRISWTPTGVEVRTEDTDPWSVHDGGLAAFDCAGRLTFLWLDGG
jgi:hypothetical protein